MYLVYVKHYLTPTGIKYFHHSWFPKVKATMREQKGYQAFVHDSAKDDEDCINLIVQFDDKNSFLNWCRHKAHDGLIKDLDCYRSRVYFEAATQEETELLPGPWEKYSIVD